MNFNGSDLRTLETIPSTQVKFTVVFHTSSTSSSSTPTSTPIADKQHIHRSQASTTTMTSTFDTSIMRTTTPSTHLYHSTSTPTSLRVQVAPASPTTTHIPINLSPSVAIGFGVAAGVIGIVILLTAVLYIYRCWKARKSPTMRCYEQARLWKGFTPATPSTRRTTFVELKMANMYFTELRSPATPSITLSPPLNGRGKELARNAEHTTAIAIGDA